MKIFGVAVDTIGEMGMHPQELDFDDRVVRAKDELAWYEGPAG